MTGFWSGWIIVLTATTLILITWLLFATRRMKSHNDENTTGHEFDGIIEEDNPLPQWWLVMFVVSIIFAVAYLAAYPGLGAYQGALDWSSASQHDRDAQYLEEKFAVTASEFSALSIEELIVSPAANKAGRRLFINNCAVCHGAGGEGAIGFPQLSNDIWQWGGSVEQITHSIKYGRKAAMPAWSAVMSETDVNVLAEYLLVEAQREFGSGEAASEEQAPTLIAKKGRALYSSYCVACHGPTMKGNPALGAPSLVDREWVYGASLEAVKAGLLQGRAGVMPAQESLLSDEKIRLLTAYVLSFSTNDDG